jgi:murein L,D-transpeptidase YcbB/YkuD
MKAIWRVSVGILVFGLFVTSIAPSLADRQSVKGLLQERIAQLKVSETPNVGEARIAAVAFLESFYQNRQFDPAWVDDANRDALLAAIAASPSDGLNPEDFHHKVIKELADRATANPEDPSLQADLDIVLTDALVRLGYQFFYGKVHPEQLDADWNFSRSLLADNPNSAVTSALEPGALEPFLASLRLNHPYYLTLKAALRSYREIETAGGWPMVPEGPSLKPGMDSERVGLMRRRLAASGVFDGAATDDPNVYDPALEAAVRDFQDRHGLDVDGVIGPGTLAALNVPVAARIDQIRANMERARWVIRGHDDDFIIVNIAGYYVKVVRGGDVVWQTRAIVGKPYRKTPVFTAQMTYLVINPTWTVPPTILKKDILPKVKEDPNYLTERNFHLVNADGQLVDPNKLDWNGLSSNGFPYQVVQGPGPNNALGLVKFMFPNEHFVYLHDTPSRGYFKSAQRTFSSGCIRVENPFDLVELLLFDQPSWDNAKVNKTVESGETTSVRLKQSLPVLLLYWTVDPHLSGDVRFYQDIYGRDAAIIEALDSPFEFNGG